VKRLFVDSFFYIALLNPKDRHHERAKTLSQTIGDSEFWTTDLVFVETVCSCQYPDISVAAAKLIRFVATEPSTKVVYLNAELFEKALNRYESRIETSWSFTDCLSFVVMEANDITDALTGDEHFRQAGFHPVV
jgi:uncharacterized protein